MKKRSKTSTNTQLIKIKGLVQGVGFRPFIYRLAKKCGLSGWVKNSNVGVEIKVQGKREAVEKLISLIKEKAPKNSRIEEIKSEKTTPENIDSFKIIKSKDSSFEITEISPDIAVCEDCLNDLNIQENRINYPFTNCTNCGPRFSIIKDIPYDRKKTTMDVFSMCETCKKEYTNIDDRRFHAQPVACSICGPEYIMHIEGRETNNIEAILKKISKLISQGKIIAVKGLGGYNIICDAFNKKAVDRIRKLKRRDQKPFAVMFSDILKAKEYAYINEREENILLSWQRPVVILKEKKIITKNINEGLGKIGIILPYLPFHFLLFKWINIPALVFTSGNNSEEPIIIDNTKALMELSTIADAILTYNREIFNRVDDSVVTDVNNVQRIIRRSRGFAPAPIKLKYNTDNILAVGTELKNCICVGKGNSAFLSQHIGDLKKSKTYDLFVETIGRFKKMFRVDPSIIVCDKHPDYLSTGYAEGLGLKTIKVQHHYAHIASCMAEHGIDEKVIGIAFDGTGYGDDGEIWGGEVFICDLLDYDRYSYFDYTQMPGGDMAIKEPWRMAVSYLYEAFGDDISWKKLPFLSSVPQKKIDLVLFALKNRMNSPLTSSVGRLFDGVSALLDICLYSSYEAEAPMKLEGVLTRGTKEYYEIEIDKTIKVKDIIKRIVNDINDRVNKDVISAKFHNTIVFIINKIAESIRKEKNINKVVLSGGLFQNAYILEKAENLLKKNNFNVYSHEQVPTNDAGIALGQIAIAAKRRKK